jgi:hypothetical protein
MYVPSGNSQFCFPLNLRNVFETFAGKQNYFLRELSRAGPLSETAQ